MTDEQQSTTKNNVSIASGSAGGFYFMGFVGAAIYYVSHSHSFWDGALGLLKAFVWPGFLVYEALSKLGA